MTSSPPMWTIGKSQRTNLKQSAAPGPGELEQLKKVNLLTTSIRDLDNITTRMPDQEFPKVKIAEKFPESKSSQKMTPGVGSYNPSKKTLAGPKYSFGSRNDIFTAEYTPGPAAYNISKLLDMKKCPSSKFGKSLREPLHKTTTQTPAPNFYQTAYEPSASPEHQFGTGTRDQTQTESQQFPGPGHYAAQSQLSKKSTTIISRRQQKNASQMNFPGPGTYQADRFDNFYRIPCTRIGYQLRANFASSNTPGPGEYVINDSNRANSVTHKIGTSQRQSFQGKEKINYPGPGSYELRKNSLGGPTYYIGKKLNYQAGSEGPGPGNYQPIIDSIALRSSTHVIGTSQRPALTRTQATPGPGNYNIMTESSGCVARFDSNSFIMEIRIGNAIRQGMEKLTDEPGPGAYEIPVKFADVPAYQMSKIIKSTFD